MVLVRGQHTAQVGNDHVGLLGQHDPGRKLLDEFDAVGKAVGRRDLARHLDGVIGLDRVDAPRAELARQHRENPGAGADVDDDRAGRNSLPQRTDVGIHPHAVGDHLAVTGDAIRTQGVRRVPARCRSGQRPKVVEDDPAEPVHSRQIRTRNRAPYRHASPRRG